MWFVNFSLRLWRFWILCDKSLNLQQHFVTCNISDCVEINAHSLLLIMNHLKKENLPHLFMPWKFSSQSCESFFRLLRSASSTSSTQTNFSVRSFVVEKGRKVDASLRAQAENIKDGVFYPRAQRPFDKDSQHISYELPSEEEIETIVLLAQTNAEKELAMLGMILLMLKFQFIHILIFPPQQG